MALILLVACSSGRDFDATASQVQAVEKEYGITADRRADFRNGSRILFFGDSITAGGVKEDGYVTLVAEAIKVLYPDRRIDVRGSGVVGDTVGDLSRRLRRDVLARRPTHVVVYVGVNDAASLGSSDVALEQGAEAYRAGLTDLVTRIRAAGAWVMICTPGLIGEDVQEGSRVNQRLDRYARVVRELASELGTGLCDLRSAFTEHLATRNAEGRRSGILTVDGIHLNEAGNRLVARSMLRSLVASAPSVSPLPPPDLPEGPSTAGPTGRPRAIRTAAGAEQRPSAVGPSPTRIARESTTAAPDAEPSPTPSTEDREEPIPEPSASEEGAEPNPTSSLQRLGDLLN